MMNATKTKITVETTVGIPMKKAWEIWTLPQHITRWAFASDEWHCPSAENDLRDGGRFVSRMEAKDGSLGFDFSGKHDKVIDHRQIDSTMDDGRTMSVMFSEKDGITQIVEVFEAEDTNSIELQRSGWQAILDNFKKYAEAQA